MATRLQTVMELLWIVEEFLVGGVPAAFWGVCDVAFITSSLTGISPLCVFVFFSLFFFSLSFMVLWVDAGL